MDAAAKPRWLERVKAWPWPDVGATAAVVVVGVTQPLLALIRQNADYFPKEAWFHLSVLAWAALLPTLLLLGTDLAITRWAGRGRLFTVWRAALYTFLFASALRQTQVYYPAPFNWFLQTFPPRPFTCALLGLVLLLCVRFREPLHRYAAALGLLAATLVLSYAYGVGLLGAAWRRPAVTPAASTIAWKGDPVIVLLFDELSNDALLKDGRIDAELFPNFAALAADSAWFSKARTNHLYTKEAIPCMLTGRVAPADEDPKLFHFLPDECGLVAHEYFEPTYGWMRRNAKPGQVYLLSGAREETLRDVLGVPRVLGELFRITPFSHSPFGVVPARRVLPPLLRGRNDTDRTSEAEVARFFNGFTPAQLEGRLTWWHAPIPHFPFTLNPDGTRHGSSSNEIIGPYSMPTEGPPPDYSIEKALANYRLQIGYVDRVLGRIVDGLKRDGLYERTTLVVTSDHGLRTWGALPPEGWPLKIPGGMVRVPLLIRGPRVKPGEYAVDYQHVDFTPTVLDALGVPYDPKRFEGVSGFAAERPPRPLRVWDSDGRLYAPDEAKDILIAGPLPK